MNHIIEILAFLHLRLAKLKIQFRWWSDQINLNISASNTTGWEICFSFGIFHHKNNFSLRPRWLRIVRLPSIFWFFLLKDHKQKKLPFLWNLLHPVDIRCMNYQSFSTTKLKKKVNIRSFCKQNFIASIVDLRAAIFQANIGGCRLHQKLKSFYHFCVHTIHWTSHQRLQRGFLSGSSHCSTL